jgi:ketosteroid isomerase-like protein
MNRPITLAVIVASMFMISSCAGNQQATPPPAATAPASSENAEQTITKLEHDWVGAIVNKDTATIERLLADDFVGTTDDQMYSREDAIEDVKSGTHEKLDLENITVRQFDNVAVVTMGQNEKSKHGDKDFSGHYLFTNVWVKRDGQWRAVASHGSRIR